MNNAPVVIFAYNRPAHFQQTVDALALAEGAEETELHIFIDGARKGDEASVQMTIDIARNINKFKSVEIVCRKNNIGLAQNIIGGVSDVLKNNESVIVLEDDLIVSKGFLKYMNNALEFYRDKNIFSIAGYTPDVDFPSDYEFSTYMMNRNCSWGWATWREKWKKTDWQVADFDDFIRDQNECKAFNKAGNDLTTMLLRQHKGEIGSWSIRFCYAGFKHGEPTVYPIKSLIKNGGADGSGTNVNKTHRYESKTVDYIDAKAFVNDKSIDERILKSFRKTYNCSLFRQTINMLKRWQYIAGIKS